MSLRRYLSPHDALVCEFCSSSGPFEKESFRKAWDARVSATNGFSYSTTWTQIQQSSQDGCHWCGLLLSKREDTYRPMTQETVEITVHFMIASKEEEVTPKGIQKFCLVMNQFPRAMYYVSTTSGTSAMHAYIFRCQTAHGMTLQMTPPLRSSPLEIGRAHV